MTYATTTFTFDPTWPWSIPGGGLLALAIVGVVLVGLTVWTYLGLREGRTRRLIVVLLLRLGALAVAAFLILRPSLAYTDDELALPSRLLILVDNSQSMTFTDEFNNLSRWDNARRLLSAPAVVSALKRLAAEQRLEVIYYQGAEDIAKFDPQGKADGKRTDIGQWLHALFDVHGRDSNLRGLLLFSDGRDNGTRFSALEKAALWRGICAIHPFALGRETTTTRQGDIAFVDPVEVEPDPVYVKTKFTVKGHVRAPGFANAFVKLRLLIDDKEVIVKKVQLSDSSFRAQKMEGEARYQVKIEADAPLKAGEIKVTLKVDPMPDEATPLNNEISTYVTVYKEGVSVLWVEGKKRLESVFATRYALSRDPRFRVTFDEILLGQPALPGKIDRYNFDKQHYDVIVIGDISADRFAGGAGGDNRIFAKIRDLVEKKGTGLLMLGGYESFANSNWQQLAPKLAAILPVELDTPGQIEGEKSVKVRPTERGLDYLLRLHDQPKKNQELWDEKLEPLDGMTNLGKVKIGAEVLATRDGQEPVLVRREVDNGRTLAFAGDTTWRTWRRSKEAIAAHQRFWKQLILWLAHQEKAEGNVRVTPDTRRLQAAANRSLGFTVEYMGEGGKKVENAQFKARVIGPDGADIDVPTSLEDGKVRGYFRKTDKPGEYRVVADILGQKEKPGEAKFMCYALDVEKLFPAANHDLLHKLAQQSGGKFFLADEQKLVQLLDELRGQKTDSVKPRAELWPDWRRRPCPGDVGEQLEILWNSTALACFLVFCVLLCLEWFLRRRWGWV